jgi:tRNA(fMet)-specific endonuclease VapC
MILLDTDHVTVLRYREDPRCQRLLERLRQANDPHRVISAVSVEEQMRGWLAKIAKLRHVHDQVPMYDRLCRMVEFRGAWELVRLEAAAADQFEALRPQRIRIGTQDLKIASIALVRNALLLSANLRDFRKVPGLRVKSWID